MTGTDDDHNILLGDWWPYCAALAFVARYVGTDPAARGWLFHRLDLEQIAWAYDRLRISCKPTTADAPLPPVVISRTHPKIRSAEEAEKLLRQYFWQQKLGAIIDAWSFDNSARHVGPAILLDPDFPEPLPDRRYEITLEATGVRLRGEDILRALRQAGYMPSIRGSLHAGEAADTASVVGSVATNTAQEDRGRLVLLPEEPQFEELRKWRPKQALDWLKQAMKIHPRKDSESNKDDWAKRLYHDHMVQDFGEDIPWSDWQTLRRRMNDQAIKSD